MFATPIPRLGQAFFSGSSMLIAIPSGINIFCWIATLWGGKPRIKMPLLWCLGFIALFVLGGLTGVMLASVSFNTQAHDTFFVVAHFHYVLIGGAVFPLFGAIYYWFPKWTGRLLNETIGRWNFWLFFIGFNLTFFPMHILGLHGMTRRIYTYVAETGWGNLNLLATIGAGVMGFSILTFLANVVWSLKRGLIAGANPWGAGTLEWATPSPPPCYSYLHLPTVRGRDALWDKFETAPVVVGLSAEKREVLTTALMDAHPQHKYELAGDSIWPVLLALAAGGSFIGAIFNPWAIPIGAGLSGLVLGLWFWCGNTPASLKARAPKHRSSLVALAIKGAKI
jgi:cytochrome c oxidase subunit I+III